MKKTNKALSLILCIIIFSLVLSQFVAYAYSDSRLPNPEQMTIREFLILDQNTRDALIEDYASIIMPEINTRYKSGEDDPTHSDITAAALTMLINDKGFWLSGTDGALTAIAICVASRLPDYSNDASYVAANHDHFYVPSTGYGLSPFKRSAKEAFSQYFQAAVSDQLNGNDDVLLNLGRALHYVQDVSVPHHTISYLTIAHSVYETYCANNSDSFLSNLTTMPQSMYTTVQNKSPNNIIIDLATSANSFYPLVNSSNDQSHWLNTANTLMKTSAKISAGVIYKFAVASGLTLYAV